MARSPLVDRPDTEIPVPVTVAPEAAGEPEARAEMAIQFKAMAAFLKKQPKVKIRLPEDVVVMLNGYSLHIKGKTTVEVPELVAEVIGQSQELGRF